MALDTAIRHLKTGNLRKAHDVVQNDPSEFGCWAHGIVHLIEGDLPNAGQAAPVQRSRSALFHFVPNPVPAWNDAFSACLTPVFPYRSRFRAALPCHRSTLPRPAGVNQPGSQ